MAMGALAEAGEPAIAKENIGLVVRLLLSDTSEVVTRIGESPDGSLNVCANLKRIMDLVRLKEVEGAVRAKLFQTFFKLFQTFSNFFETFSIFSKIFCTFSKLFQTFSNIRILAQVRDRFGASACRIFRLLTIKRQLEQKQVAEMSMLPVKDTRETLYRLLKANFVTLQEVAQTTDHNPQRTFYVWRVDIPKAVDTLAAEVVRATSNL
jgi:hypothetical protein